MFAVFYIIIFIKEFKKIISVFCRYVLLVVNPVMPKRAESSLYEQQEIGQG
jgi:hypothetical protein